ncbi:MAG TPA: malto-oligosyltrehalose trehalohydrolase, partial [Burkholderiales bacterium]|nr:malto-oligosyltrehalose trehalohydrolase [Burkholderiales bacterium]
MNSICASATRRLPVGAELLSVSTASFRVWAPRRDRVTLVIESGMRREVALQREPEGYFSATVDGLAAGTLYRYRLDDEEALHPDPVSRAQPRGHDGPSQLVDPSGYRWRDGAWRGVTLKGQVAYEMHIGTYTAEGTWRAAARELPWLAQLGVTLLEVMPVGEFPGSFGWGYDVVHHYAPSHLYGSPDDMRAFVDEAHALGMGVILDVVYNHCASVGCFLQAYTSDYFTDRYRNDWGHAFNFDGASSAPVREYVASNVEYWIREFHLDGFRLDATQSMYDSSDKHIIADISEHARAAAAGRDIVLIGENEPQDIALTRPSAKGGGGLDALWNDDFHHSARVAMTGRREAYYHDYLGTPQELISAVKWGFLFQGQYYAWQKKCRGTPSLAGNPQRFVLFLQNHDQVANSARGWRIDRLTDKGRWRACTALMLLAPGTPLLFQGQEFAASSPFLYFADNGAEIAPVVRDGRREFLSQFRSIAAGGDVCLIDPASREAYERSKLDLRERETHSEAVALHRDLLALRRTDPVFSAQRAGGVDGAVLASEALVLRYFDRDGTHGDRLLVVNLGR